MRNMLPKPTQFSSDCFLSIRKTQVASHSSRYQDSISACRTGRRSVSTSTLSIQASWQSLQTQQITLRTWSKLWKLQPQDYPSDRRIWSEKINLSRMSLHWQELDRVDLCWWFVDCEQGQQILWRIDQSSQTRKNACQSDGWTIRICEYTNPTRQSYEQDGASFAWWRRDSFVKQTITKRKQLRWWRWV